MATTWVCLLRIKTAGSDDRSHVIEKTVFTIGRAEDSDFPLNDPSVSRGHLKVELRGPFVYVTDMKSGNGTRVNGTRIAADTPVAVSANDVVIVGRTAVELQFSSIPHPEGYVVPSVVELPAVPLSPAHAAIVDLQNQKQSLELELAELRQKIASTASEERLKYAKQADQLVTEAQKRIAQDYHDASVQIEARMQSAQEKLFAMTQDAETRSREVLREAQDEALRIRSSASEETRALHQEALQRHSAALAALQDKFQADMAAKREEMIARARAEAERERARVAKAGADEVTLLEKTVASLRGEVAPLQQQRETAIAELKRLDELTTVARQELERDSALAEDVRAWVARANEARRECDVLEMTLSDLNRRVSEAQVSVDAEIGALRQKALLELETEKKAGVNDLAKSKLRALEDLQKRIQDEEKKYTETLSLRAVELSQRLSARLLPMLPELASDTTGVRLKEAIDDVTRASVMNASAFTAPVIDDLSAPVKTASERTRRNYKIAAGAFAAFALIAVFFGRDIYAYCKGMESHSYASEKIAERKIASVFHPEWDLRYGTTYRGSYTENVLFFKGYFEARKDEFNQRKWLLRLSDINFFRPMGLTEDDMVAFVARENALIDRLGLLEQRIDGVYAEQGIKSMSDAEEQDLAEMRRILKSDANLATVRTLEREFFTQLIR